MFIGHLPAAYLATKALQTSAGGGAAVHASGLIASVLPDLDLFWFYLVDQRQVAHHEYLTHTPFFWIVAAVVGLAASWLMKWRWGPLIIGVAFLNLMIHLALDSIAADVMWLWPFSTQAFGLVEVPARHSWWVWNFVFHWTFALELLVISAALWVFICLKKRPER